MKKLFIGWIVPLLIGALVVPTFVGCDELGEGDGDEFVDSDGDGVPDSEDEDYVSSVLTPDEQKAKLQEIAVSAISSIDVASTKPALDALEYMIDRLEGVEVPSELDDFADELDDYQYEDVVTDSAYEDYYDDSNDEVLDSVFVGDDDDYTYEYDELDDAYVTRSGSALLIKQLMSLSSVASGDLATLSNYAMATSEEFDFFVYASDVYGIYTLGADDTWSKAESDNTLAFIVDGYELSFTTSGDMSVEFPSEWDFEDVTVSVPTAASVKLTYNGSSIMAVSMAIDECNLSSYIFASSASASFADFELTADIDITNSASSIAATMSYNGNTFIDMAVGVDDINIQSSIKNEELKATGGVMASIKMFGGALCFDAATKDLSDFVDGIIEINEEYPWTDNYTSSYDENDNYSSVNIWGEPEEYGIEMAAHCNEYLTMVWGFGSTSVAQGSIEFDSVYESESSSYESPDYNGDGIPDWTNNYTWSNSYTMPIMVFADDSRIEIESFFTESAFESTINSAIELASDMISLMSDYNFDLD